MSNPYYTHTTYPGPNAPGSSAALRAELELIAAAFDKLPTLAGNAGKLVRVNDAGDGLEAGGQISSVDFSLTGIADAVGRLTWNDTDGTLNLGLKGGNVVLQIGQEEVLRVLNTTGSTLTSGQAVYIVGASGQRPTVALAQANAEATSTKVIGIVTETIANNAQGFVATAGLVRGVNTSAFAEGVVLWLSAGTAGAITSTRPTAPNHAVMVGYCVRSHATDGIIYVMVQNGYELDELHDVLISSVANNNMLRYNSALGVWQNIAGPAGAVVGTTDTQTLTNKTISGGTVTGAAVTGLSTPSGSTDAANKGYVDTQIATRLALAGGTMSGAIAMGSNKITGLGTPTDSGDATTKGYVDAADALKLNLSGGTMSGAIAMGTNRVTGMGDPVNLQDAATKNYVDSVAQGLDVKGSVRVATTANITLSGTQTIDGVAVIAGDRVLVKDQTAQAENGVYVVASGAWARSADMDVWSELPGAFLFVEAGTVNDNSGWVCTVSAGGTLGSTAVTFEQFSGAGQINAGAGLTKSGNTIQVNTASSARIVVGADEIDLATTGVTAGTYRSITVDQWGRVTAGTNPTTISGYGITDAYTKTEVDTALALKLNLSGGTMSGAIAMGGNKVTGLGAPTAAGDAATKTYVDTADALKLNLSGGTMSGNIAMGGNMVSGLGAPTSDNDAVRLKYVTDLYGSTASAANSAADALTYKNDAAASASAAASSASAASTSASNASSSASSASSSASAAASSASAAAASFDSFDDRYLGAKSTPPLVDNDGNPLLTGALYFDTSSSEMRVYTGSAWLAAYVPATGYLALAGGTMTGNITFAGTQTFAGSAVSGNISGNAANVTGIVAVANGGTGASSAANARTNLGLEIGTNVQAWDADLNAIAALAGTSGFLKKTAANTWSLDTSTYLTGNQTITVSGDATGSGATAITLTLANSGVTAGTYTKVTVDAKGRVTTGASLASADLPTYTGTLTSSQVTTALGYTPYNSTNPNGYITSSGTAANVSGTVAIANGGTGATTAAAARTNLGATTLGSNLFTLTNVAAISFPRINADNTISTLDAATFRTAIGAGTSSTTGTVTSVSGTGTVSGLTLTGTVTTSGSLTLGGTLSVTPSNFASQTANTVLAAPNGAAGVPTFRALVAADIPTLNQNTTGSAATLTTGRTIGMTGDVTWTSAAFNGSANVTGTATLANSGVTAGTYTKITVDAKGRATAGTTLAASDIPELTLAKLPGAAFKQSVRCATTANITLSGTQTIDGIAVVAGDRVLVKSQTAPAENGIYVASAGAWTRALDADAADEIGAAVVNVDAGTANGGELWTTTFRTTDTLGTTAMNWFEVLYNSGTWNISISGSSASTSGNAATATALQTARTINGVSFNGTANITVTANTPNSLTLATSGVGLSGSATFNGGSAQTFTVTSNATSANTASTIVARDASGNFSAGTVTAALSGNATTATTLQTARTIALSGAVTGTATSFNGSANITIPTTVSTTQGGVVYGGSATAYATTAAGTAGFLLASNGTSAPTWVENSLLSFPGSTFKKSVRVATTAALTLNTAQTTIDGVTITATDRVLVKNQATASQNGIYTGLTTTSWVRAVDADSSAEIGSAIVAVDEGTANGGEVWTTTFKPTDTLGTTAMNWFEMVYNTGTWAISTTGSAATLTTGRTIGMTGDVTWTSASFNGSANVTGTATLANSGVTAGTYTKVTVDAKGRVTTGASLASSDVTTALGYTPLSLAGGTMTGNITFASTQAFTGATATLSGALTLNGGTANGVPYLNASKVATTGTALTFDGFYLSSTWADKVTAVGNTGTAQTLNLRNGNVFTATLTGNCTFTLSNAVAGSSFTMVLTNDATASRTVAWAGYTFRFPGGAASLGRTTTANATDVWFFFTPDGSTFYGSIPMKNLAA